MATPLDSRIANWQADGHKIGMVEFHPVQAAQTRFPYYTFPNDQSFIGVMETDAIVVHSDGSVRVYDHECKNRILCPAGIDQRCFVAAMTELERHFATCDENERYSDDIEAAVAVRNRCAELAGGDEYLPFFTSIVGV